MQSKKRSVDAVPLEGLEKFGRGEMLQIRRMEESSVISDNEERKRDVGQKERWLYRLGMMSRDLKRNSQRDTSNDMQMPDREQVE